MIPESPEEVAGKMVGRFAVLVAFSVPMPWVADFRQAPLPGFIAALGWMGFAADALRLVCRAARKGRATHRRTTWQSKG